MIHQNLRVGLYRTTDFSTRKLRQRQGDVSHLVSQAVQRMGVPNPRPTQRAQQRSTVRNFSIICTVLRCTAAALCVNTLTTVVSIIYAASRRQTLRCAQTLCGRGASSAAAGKEGGGSTRRQRSEGGSLTHQQLAANATPKGRCASSAQPTTVNLYKCVSPFSFNAPQTF